LSQRMAANLSQPTSTMLKTYYMFREVPVRVSDLATLCQFGQTVSSAEHGRLFSCRQSAASIQPIPTARPMPRCRRIGTGHRLIARHQSTEWCRDVHASGRSATIPTTGLFRPLPRSEPCL
jgi:hypothetical protein